MLQARRTRFAPLLVAGVLVLGAAAPAAQASEVVKLARLVITGKWTSGASGSSADQPAKAPAPEKQPAPEAANEPVQHGPSAQLTVPGPGVHMLAAHKGRTIL